MNHSNKVAKMSRKKSFNKSDKFTAESQKGFHQNHRYNIRDKRDVEKFEMA